MRGFSKTVSYCVTSLSLFAGKWLFGGTFDTAKFSLFWRYFGRQMTHYPLCQMFELLILDPSSGLPNSSTGSTLNSFATPPSRFSPSSDRQPLTASSPKTSRSNSHENKTSDDFTDVTSIENFSETEELIQPTKKKEGKPYEFLLNW